MKIDIKPLSVNVAWQGRRFRSKEYKAYQQEVALKLRKMTLPEPPYTLLLEFGVSNKAADYDNPIKPFQDCLQAFYGFNDSQIYEGVQRKVIVPKGEEYVKFSILPLIDLSHLFDNGANLTEREKKLVVEALIEDRESLEQEEMSTPYTHEDYEDRIAELEKDLEQSIEHIDNLQFCSEERGFFYCPNCGEGTKHTKDCYIGVFLDKHKP